MKKPAWFGVVSIISSRTHWLTVTDAPQPAVLALSLLSPLVSEAQHIHPRPQCSEKIQAQSVGTVRDWPHLGSSPCHMHFLSFQPSSGPQSAPQNEDTHESSCRTNINLERRNQEALLACFSTCAPNAECETLKKPTHSCGHGAGRSPCLLLAAGEGDLLILVYLLL